MPPPSLERYTIIDTETTGFSPKQNRVIEVGAIRVEAGRVVAEYQALIQTVERVPAAITRFTGITTAMVKNDGQDPFRVFAHVRELVGDDLFVAHNVYFDFNFLNAEFAREELPLMQNLRVCTARLAKTALPHLPNHQLGTIKNHLDLDFQSHRALTDETRA